MTNTMKKSIAAITLLAVLAGTSVAMAGEAKGKSDSVVNINTATVVELAYLPGVGPATAERIVKYRKGRPFKKSFHITRVKGIGRKTYKKIEKYLTISGTTTATGKIKIPRD